MSQAHERTSPIKRWLPVGGAAICLAAFFIFGGAEYISLDWLKENRTILTDFVARHAVWAAFGRIGIYAALVAISFPGASLLTIFAGFMFGTIVGTSTVVVGATLGAVAIFLMSKSTFGDALAKRAGPAIDALREGFQRDAFSYLLVLRLAPAFPFWLVNIAAGLLGARLTSFAVTTFFGIIPGSFVYASIGAGAGAVLDAGRELNLAGALLKPEVLLPIIGLSLLSFLPMVLRRLQAQPAPPQL